MIYSNFCSPVYSSPSWGCGGGFNYGSSMYDCCDSYSGGFCSPGWNSFGSSYGGFRGYGIGSAVGGLLGLGLGAVAGPWGALMGASVGSMFGGSLGYLAGSLFSGCSNPYACW